MTRKISRSAARIKLGLQKELLLGNLDSCRDWGYAPEYVEAMWLMLQQPRPDDYVVATGETHSVREFALAAFHTVGVDLEWFGRGVGEIGKDVKTGRVLVRVDPVLFRPANAEYLVGDYSKAKQTFGWSPKTTFKDLVSLMVEHDQALAAKAG